MDTSQALTADWTIWDWDDELINYGKELADSIDTILLGRKMTDGVTFYELSRHEPRQAAQGTGIGIIRLIRYSSRHMKQAASGKLRHCA